jgi:hypothetical protein
MFEHASPPAHSSKRKLEHPAIVSRPIVLAAIPLEVHGREVHPKVTRWVRDHRIRTPIKHRVPGYRPRIHGLDPGIRPLRIDKKRGDHRAHGFAAR